MATSHAFARLIQGVAVGAAAMYMLDPDRGRRRRALTRDKVQRLSKDTARLARQAARDTRQRLHGANARLQRRWGPAEANLDELRLIERVRSALGRCVSHPHAIQVGAHGDVIVLSGPILQGELPRLLGVVRAVAGVGSVEDHLDPYESADGVPALQGEGRHRDGTSPQSWTPTLRLAAAIGGGVLALYGLAKRSASGLMLASAGLGIAARVVGNEPLEGWLSDVARDLDGDSPRQPRNEPNAARRIGDDGTPAADVNATAASQPRSAGASERSAIAPDTPVLGDDGTPSAAHGQRSADPPPNQGPGASTGGEDPTRSVH
ncbi:MAG: hypothetical protein M3Z31_17290 [Pseudomonadota bacterium]|nr:hypothetical protein [Pseudomonadota bacterium]